MEGKCPAQGRTSWGRRSQAGPASYPPLPLKDHPRRFGRVPSLGSGVSWADAPSCRRAPGIDPLLKQRHLQGISGHCVQDPAGPARRWPLSRHESCRSRREGGGAEGQDSPAWGTRPTPGREGDTPKPALVPRRLQSSAGVGGVAPVLPGALLLLKTPDQKNGSCKCCDNSRQALRPQTHQLLQQLH